MGDPRLSGNFEIDWTVNRYDPDQDDVGAAQATTGSMTVSNEGGTWSGTVVGCSGCNRTGADTSYIELVGAEGHEGLSAILFVEETLYDGSRSDDGNLVAPQTPVAFGVIIPGEAPSR